MRKPLAELNCSQNTKLVKKNSDNLKFYTRRSNANLLACKQSYDLPELLIKGRKNSTRKKVYTQWDCEQTIGVRSNFQSIFKRQEQHQSIDKQLDKLQSLHNIHSNLIKELQSIETMVHDMSQAKFVRLKSMRKEHEICKCQH